VAAGFYGSHLCWLGIYATYVAFQSRNRFLGNELPFDPQIWVERFLQKALWFPLPAVFVIGFGAALILCLRGRRVERAGWLLLVGGASYLTLSGLLLVARPGALITFPLLRNWPLMVDLILLAAIPALALFALFRGGPRALACTVAMLALHVVLVWLPHDIGRALWHLTLTKLPADDARVLVFVVDAARLDAVQAMLPAGDHPSVARGVSHFGSTRKQWRLLLTGDEQQVAQSFFIPTLGELRDRRQPHFLPQQARRAGLKTALLIDDPQTLSRSTLGIDLDACYMPHDGFFDAIIADSTLFPVCSWLLNILGPVEALNAWSQPAAFRRDVERTLRGNQMVFAHTVRLQKGIFTMGEMRTAAGAAWLFKRPREFALISEKAHAHREGVDARAVYDRKLRQELDDTSDWLKKLCARLPVAAVLTSDHGQEFMEMPPGDRHYAGLHGWSVGPETVWIPFLAYGSAKIAGPADGNLSWLSMHGALVEWMQQRGALTIHRQTDPIAFGSHFIATTHLSGRAQETVPEDIVTMARIIRAIRVDPALGAVLADEFAQRPFRRSMGEVRGGRLRATNPTEDGGTVVVEWDLYALRN
jgi:hypothetical protein